MKSKLLIALFSIAAALTLGACTGGSGQLAATSWPGVTATEDTVYLAFGPHVYAIDSTTGDEIWRFPAEADNKISFYAAPALSPDGRKIFAGGYDNNLYSINADNGQAGSWTYTGASNRYIGNVLTTGEAIYAPNASGNLIALDYGGNPLWDQPYNTDQPQWSAPASDGSTLYIAALDHQIHAVDMASGELVWTLDLETAATGTPAISDGVLYAGTFGKKVFAVNTATGEKIWTFETQDWVWASPAVSGSLVVAGDISGNLYAIDANTGDEIWTFEAEGGIFGAPLIIGDEIYFGTEAGKFYALTFDKATSWFYTLTGKIYSQAVYNGEYLFVATLPGDAVLTALDLDGVAHWPFNPESEQ